MLVEILYQMAFRSERKNDKSGGFQEETRKFFSPEYFFSDKKIAFEKECTYLGIEVFLSGTLLSVQRDNAMNALFSIPKHTNIF